MALAISKENYTLHKIHSLTGIIPVGYYLVQHLTLNTFSLGGPQKFDAVLGFFSAMPPHFLWALKLVAIWIPLIFHAVYGVFIASRAKFNYGQQKYKFNENRYFTFQRATGILAFLFLVYHMTSTSINGAINGEHVIQYATWAERLRGPNGTYLVLIAYLVGIAASSYHFAFGIWSFCIRWGITISEASQKRMWNVAKAAFVLVTVIGYVALAGFFWAPFASHGEAAEAPAVEAPQDI